MMLNDILDALFPAGHAVKVDDKVITGEAQTAQGAVTVLGTTDAAAIDHRMALALAACVLDTVERHPGRPLVFLVDTSGQALSRSQELLCLNGSLAHLASCVDLARRQGHPSLSLVTANAVSGGFLSFGLMADRAYALADAQVRVMDLRAMSRVTKIAHERLVELAASSPTFAPGAENYLRMGGIEAIWPAPESALLEQALAIGVQPDDQRMGRATERGGRLLAKRVAETVETAVAGA
jgi:malonate decarboxylase gamma subunit